MTTPMQVYRQGDVLFIPIEQGAVPKDATRLGSRLIRRGEHGGLHSLERETVAVESRSTIMVHKGVKYVLSPNGVGIVHDEHHRLQLPAGTYRVRVQREGNGQQSRFVMD